LITVVITESEYQKAQAIFDETTGMAFVPVSDDEPALSDAIRRTGTRFAIIGHQPYVDELYRAVPAGGLLARFGVGHDGVDKAKATAAGIFCTNTPDTLVDSVAEHTIALLLAFSRKLVPMATAMSRGNWTPQLGLEVRGRRLAIIGVGAIGLRTAKIASVGLGMAVVVCGRAESTRPAHLEDSGIGFTRNLDETLRDSEFISVHIPGTKENFHFLDRRRLDALQTTTCVINTSRGSVIDEVALYDVLAAGRIAGAALDVFTAEPYVPAAPDKDLRKLDNVVLTPHVGSYTETALRRMAERAIQNVRAAEEGRYTELDLLNPCVLKNARPR
jgi:lactate dehydrogenase-like 2-hydroxyacid dehydrogenase